MGSEAKYFDVMSWDPRGTGDTTPHLNCFPLAYNIWSFKTTEDGIPGSSSVAISNLWARTKASSALCSQNDEVVNHMNTPVLVGDMVEIIEKHGEWGSKQAETWLDSMEGKVATAGKASSDLVSREAITDRTKWMNGEEKLIYWGFSYGTVVGSTFSAMQPHRVDRVIVDGVVDTETITM
jgi:pimeloyl-ACP methyl ester carboxylesterase